MIIRMSRVFSYLDDKINCRLHVEHIVHISDDNSLSDIALLANLFVLFCASQLAS